MINSSVGEDVDVLGAESSRTQGRASPHLDLANPRMILAPLGVGRFFASTDVTHPLFSIVQAVPESYFQMN